MFEFDFIPDEEENKNESEETSFEDFAEAEELGEGDSFLEEQTEQAPVKKESEPEILSVFQKGQELGYYKIIRCLSRAGIGETYLVSQALTHKRYVLKILPKILMKDKEFEVRFFEWKDRVLDLNHPNIVQTVELQKDKGFFFIVMEYIEGEEGLPVTLEDKLLKKQHFSRDEIKKFIIQLCKLLEYALNKNNLLHSDLKPENILYDVSGNIKLSNFCLIDIIGIEFFKELFRLAVSQNIKKEAPQEVITNEVNAEAIDKTSSFMLLGKDQNVRFFDIDNITQSGKVYLQNLISDTSSFAADDFKEIEKEVEQSSQDVPRERNSIMNSFDYMSPEQKIGSSTAVTSEIYSIGLILYRILTGAKVTGNWGLPSTYGRSWDWDDIVVKCLKVKPSERFQSLAELREAVQKVGRRRNKIVVTIACVAMLAVVSTTVAGLYYFKSGKLPFQLTKADEIIDINKPVSDKQQKVEVQKTNPVVISVDPAGFSYTVFKDNKIVDSGAVTSANQKTIKLPAGQYILKVEKAGYLPSLQYIVVGDKEEFLELALSKKPEKNGGNGNLTKPAFGRKWIVPGINIEFVAIPAGSGKVRFKDNQTQRVSFEKPFWAGKYEVSQIEFEDVVWKKTSFFKMSGLDAPVDSVTWKDATDFCVMLTKKEKALGRLPEGYEYRLPTYEEWEYCSRAGSMADFSFGNDAEKLKDFAWYFSNSKKRSHPKGSKMSNQWGLYDMLGNVWEWCYRPTQIDGNKIDPAVTDINKYLILRGGSWNDPQTYLQYPQNVQFIDSVGFTNPQVGFRVVLAPALENK